MIVIIYDIVCRCISYCFLIFLIDHYSIIFRRIILTRTTNRIFLYLPLTVLLFCCSVLWLFLSVSDSENNHTCCRVPLLDFCYPRIHIFCSLLFFFFDFFFPRTWTSEVRPARKKLKKKFFFVFQFDVTKKTFN